jgi:glycosyltransferase involved in cell wall biosynthesis
MRRILIVQPSMQPPGGGNGVAAWMLQALVDHHDVTVLSWHPVDVTPINRFFGTSLLPDRFRSLVVPASWQTLPNHLPVPVALLKSSVIMRYTRKIADGYDVIMGIHNETDYGRRGIQYVHYPTYLRPRPDADLRWYHRSKSLLQAYYSVADRVAGFSLERMKANLTLANSDWTAGQIQRFLGITSRTLYPPVADPAPSLPWSQRVRGFLSVGRISPEKEYERSMRILARVRRTHPDITFTIVGTTDRHGRRYYNHLQRLAEVLGPWVQFRHDLSRDEVRALMAGHRYGIHGMREEHFGMAPAELVRAGVIVWVPNGGGQVEIVGGENRLRYSSEDEAVESITNALSDAVEEERLRVALAERAGRFAVSRFVAETRDIVEGFTD